MADTSGMKPLAAQFEYRRHMRAYRAAYPEATLAQVGAVWWEKHGRPRSEWDDEPEAA